MSSRGLLGVLAASMVACGPTASTSGGTGDGGGTSSTSSETTNVASSTGSVAESSSTGAPSFCDGEPLSESAWCHTAVDFDVSPMEVRRVFPSAQRGEDGGVSLLLHGSGGSHYADLALPDVFQEFALQASAPLGFELRGFAVEPPMGSTSRLTPVRIFTDAEARHDYLPQSVTQGCRSGPLLASPARAAQFRPTSGAGWSPEYGFEDCRRALFSPISLVGEAVDAFFYYCDTLEDEFCLSVDPDPPTGWVTSTREDLPVVQRLPGPGCEDPLDGPVDLVVGRFDGSNTESLVLLPRPCDGEATEALRTVVDAGDGRVAWGSDVALGSFADLGVSMLDVADIDQDGFDDLLLMGPDVLGVMRGGKGGLTPPARLPVAPHVLPHFDSEILAGGPSHLYHPNIRLAVGQLDETGELEFAVRVEDGIQLLSRDGARSLLLDEPASDLAIVDADADGIDDLALTFDAGMSIRIYLSAVRPP